MNVNCIFFVELRIFLLLIASFSCDVEVFVLNMKRNAAYIFRLGFTVPLGVGCTHSEPSDLSLWSELDDAAFLFLKIWRHLAAVLIELKKRKSQQLFQWSLYSGAFHYLSYFLEDQMNIINYKNKTSQSVYYFSS